MALGPRSLRTKKLTEKIPSFSPRTIYRHARALADIGLVDREEVEGVPSTVVHSLSPAGRDLYRLLRSYAKVSAASVSGPGGYERFWAVCGLLGEMWKYGWIEELGHGGRSATELTEVTSEMNFHQVGRRTHQLLSWSLIYKSAATGNRNRYQLSDEARRGMALVTGLGRWRQQHVEGEADAGLTVEEMATVLRVSLPLLQLPEHRGRNIKLGIVGTTGEDGRRGSATLTASVSDGGSVRCVKDKLSEDAWAIGAVDNWFAALIDNDRKGMRTGGTPACVGDCLKGLRKAFWTVTAT
jgi:DNA-binding HxlR family transcriptional regulator